MSVSEFPQASAAAPADRAPIAGAPRRTRALTAATVIILTLLGAVIRVIVARQPLFADELSTYWISATHGLRGVMSLMYGTGAIKHAEITPPMYFVAAWLATRAGHTAMALRAPSLIAGVLTIPLVYQLGLRAVGRRAGLIACGLVALSPFAIYYSTEARAYAVMMLLASGATLSLLLALDTARRRWWVLYAVCCAGVIYTHYTGAFVLAAQLLWVLVFHPQARRAVILANLGAAVLVAPWLPGLINDYRSPTTKILSLLSPFTPDAVWTAVSHWALGYPYAKLATLSQLPGVTALVLIAAGTACAVAGLLARLLAERPPPGALDRRIVLVVALVLATPVCEAVQSLLSTHTFGTRNLAASWIPAALAFGLLLNASGRRVRVFASALALAGFLLSGLSMVNDVHQRPHYQQAADYVDHTAHLGDVVIDETGELSPGPLTALDLTLHRPLAIVRALAPQERDHPFGLFDPYVPLAAASRQAAALAARHRILLVGGGSDTYLTGSGGYRRIAVANYDGMNVSVFARAGSSGS
jgi:4-amino-4-deoxy-L-arabinose transferase-like glycosyltransferase